MRTALQQAHVAAKAALDHYRLNNLRREARRYRLRPVQEQGRAKSFVVQFLDKRDDILDSQYLGLFYEDVDKAARGTQLCVQYDGAEQFLTSDLPVDAPWAAFVELAVKRIKFGTSALIDTHDAMVLGVRRIGFTIAKTCRPVLIHVADL